MTEWRLKNLITLEFCLRGFLGVLGPFLGTWYFCKRDISLEWAHKQDDIFLWVFVCLFICSGVCCCVWLAHCVVFFRELNLSFPLGFCLLLWTCPVSRAQTQLSVTYSNEAQPSDGNSSDISDLTTSTNQYNISNSLHLNAWLCCVLKNICEYPTWNQQSMA